MILDNSRDKVTTTGACELADCVGVDRAVTSEGGERGLRKENVGDFVRV